MAGVEGGAVAEGLAAPAITEQGQEKDSNGLGEMDGEGVEAEDAEAEGDEPVGEGRFLKVANAVDVKGDEIAGGGHVTGGVGVGGVGVVEQWWSEERGEEEEEPETAEQKQSGGASRGVCRESCRAFGERFRELLWKGLIGHEIAVFY